MSRLKFPKNMPQEIRDLINMDFSRENRNPTPGCPLPSMPSQEPAAGVPSPHSSPTTEPGTSNPHPAIQETGATGRESNGRYVKGNRGGPGNPFARQVAAFRVCLINCVTQDDFKAIVYRLVERAKCGNLQAIKLLFSYMLGTPKPVVEPDELDLNEMHLAHQAALAAEALQEALMANPPANDAPPLPYGEISTPAAPGVHEAPQPPPASEPSTNRASHEPCPLTASEAPSANREFDAAEAGKPAQPPSTNRPNGEPAADVSNTHPSTKGSNRKREPGAVGGAPPPRGHPASADEKQT